MRKTLLRPEFKEKISFNYKKNSKEDKLQGRFTCAY